MWDSEPIQGMTVRDAAVEFNFIIQNLTTAWPRKFDALHDFDHEKPIREVLPENMDMSKIMVKRSSSMWAKIIRGEEDLPEEEEKKENDWKGVRGLKEKTIDIRGLRLMKERDQRIGMMKTFTFLNI